jgi:hypothetical protein
MNEQQGTLPRKSGFIKWAIVIAIIVVLNLFFNYAISLVYKAPSYEGFCPNTLTSKTYTSKNMCTEAGGQWTETTAPVSVESTQVKNPVEVTGYCNATYTCQQNFDGAQSVYNRNVFIVLVILGILSLVAGAYMMRISGAVALGLSFGGVVTLIIGAIRYWSNMQDVLRVVVLAVALAALVWIGIKKIQE